MSTNVVMPKLGESLNEGTVVEWLKRVGEWVEQGEALVLIETDKVTAEIPSPASGFLLDIIVVEGVVACDTVMAIIGEKVSGEVVVESQPPVTSPQMTPVVARMVATHGLDISQIQGTGRGNRVTKKDVEAYLAASPQTANPTPVEPPVRHEEPVAKPAPPADTGLPGELVALTSMRRYIAEHMTRSSQTVPHVTTVFEMDLSTVLAHKAAHQKEFEARGVRLTLMAYVVAATAQALLKVPYINAKWTDDGIFLHRPAHIGIAVALSDGLIVPVIKDAQDKSLLGLARVINDLATKARNKKLLPEEVEGGTFSITNHGVNGSIIGTPIISELQGAILGFGLVEKRVRVINDAIAIRPCAYVSLSFDHRIADGATADQFLSEIKQTLENWRD